MNAPATIPMRSRTPGIAPIRPVAGVNFEVSND